MKMKDDIFNEIFATLFAKVASDKFTPQIQHKVDIPAPEPEKVETPYTKFFANQDCGVVYFGRTTVAWLRDGNMLNIAASTCSKQDVFNKKTGREMAIDRVIDGRCLTFPISRKVKTRRDVIRVIENMGFDEIEALDSMGSWVGW